MATTMLVALLANCMHDICDYHPNSLKQTILLAIDQLNMMLVGNRFTSILIVLFQVLFNIQVD